MNDPWPHIRAVHRIEDLHECEAIEEEVWGLSERELVPASQLSAAVHAGGMVAASYQAAKMVGFVYGFPARRPELPEVYGLHSHMLAVRPEHRGQGVGKRLKWFQRAWCLEQGLRWVTWTFDPMQAKNARLNLTHLGAYVDRYLTDVYGQLGGDLNAGLPTDRVLAVWDLRAPHVTRLAEDTALVAGQPKGAPFALRAKADGTPSEPDTVIGSSTVRVEAPADAARLITERPDAALAWRMALRNTMAAYFARGYVATGFDRQAYLFEKGCRH